MPKSDSLFEPILYLACASDDHYAQTLGVMLHSALQNIRPSTSVHLLLIDNGISADKRARLERVLSRARQPLHVDWQALPQERLGNLQGGRHISVAAYARLFVGSLLPPQARRVTYLDCDLLIRADLEAFSARELESRTVGAVRDFTIAHIAHSSSKVDWQGLNIDAQAPYFNSGVLLIDLERWREGDLEGRTLAYAIKANDAGNHDQDALNATLHGDWLPLEPKFNLQSSLLFLHENPSTQWGQELQKQRAQLLREAQIVHFSGSIKPWQPGSNHPLAAQWRAALGSCGWFSPSESLKWRLSFGLKRLAARVLFALRIRTRRERTD